MTSSNKVLICTGFHRSATSATANWLYDAGLHLGDKLVGKNVNNPKGHFEDLNIIEIHNELLKYSNTSWQYHDECDLINDVSSINDYINNRNKINSNWGVWDPRICLFLEHWNECLQENGHYLFIVRHWAHSLESIMNRHSRHLATHISFDSLFLTLSGSMNFFRPSKLH